MPALSQTAPLHKQHMMNVDFGRKDILVTQVSQPQANLVNEETIENTSKEKLSNLKLMMKGYVIGALREKEQGNTARYDELIASLGKDPTQPGALSPLRMHIWILVLSQCVSLLDKSTAKLVQAVLNVDWSVRDRAFVDVYIDFLENLVSAHSFYVVPVVNAIVSGFKYRQQLQPYAVVTRTTVYDRHHEALRGILRLIPTCTSTLFNSLSSMLPYYRQHSGYQAAYINNLFTVTEYVPFLRKQILALVIGHMVQIDSHIQIELDELEENVEFDPFHMDFDEEYNSDKEENDDSEDEEHEHDVEEDEYDSDDPGNSDVRENQIEYLQSMVRKLDAMMALTFRYLGTYAKEHTALERAELYHTLIDIFDHTIVKTLKSRYTQFLIFYFSSLDAHTFTAHFLDHLIQIVTDPAQPGVNRIACAAYISSYVARAKFMDAAMIQRAVTVLMTWCLDYVEAQEAGGRYPDVTKHDVFYAIMQAVMYIFCFRWRELIVDDPLEASLAEESAVDAVSVSELQVKGGVARSWCLGLRHMPRLVMSPFNPLKVCAPMVVKQFARIAHSTNFMYIYPILEKNKHLLIPGMAGGKDDAPSGERKNMLKALQTFFPFDPYRLESTKMYIDDIYFNWIDDDEDDDDSDEESDEEGSESEEDEEEEAVSAGISAMSISPCPPPLFLR